MSRDGESNFLTIVALVIAFIFVVAFTAGFVFWHRHAGDPRVAMSATSVTTTTATATPIVPPATETVAETATAPPVPTELPEKITDFGMPRSADAGPIADTERVLMRMRSGFRYCYNQGLAKDPSLAGTITLAIDVSASGDVTNVKKKSAGINAEVDDCLMRRARSAMFDASPSSHTVNVPLTFAQAH
jgi:TonB family protein